MTNAEVKNQIRDLLPRGFVREIQKRLLKKGIKKSVGFISQVCNPAKEKYDTVIIKEAIALAKLTKNEQEDILSLISDL